ncbi:hypothetical protein KP509_28G022600 [Ceratopteris richardii]|uniref:Uncharacterized protein n=1 Tax=Ceratopteris richardii TaxID=49495 RepID=A0A8T2RCW8_CERRI|nr:hypothetical protein KP509_28G022600 [Ceratopteris richardii]
MNELVQDLGSTSHCIPPVACCSDENSLETDLCDQLPFESTDVSDVGTEKQPPTAPSTVNERAIVLYKPVNPPLFAGGPSAGSQIRLNADFFKSGFSGAFNILHNTEDNSSRPQISGFGLNNVDMSEEEDNRCTTDQGNMLAVIPWNTTSPLNMIALQTTAQPSNDRNQMGIVDVNQDADFMEEDNESGMDIGGPDPSNYAKNILSEPWQQYRDSQSQFNPIMWSH